ncbi:MAG: prepilin-type N-terminal cleavage/methylation domain-containing protein [Pseudomonadales bacterium]|nr:prepilin-type N-terminal cleavage/methylation domain-containing protein [Pseudomonadales bacterium]
MDRGTSDNGFSIIEMLVALGIAAALIVVGVTVYVGSEKTAETVDALETIDVLRDQLGVRVASAEGGLSVCDDTLVRTGDLANQYMTLAIVPVALDPQDPARGYGAGLQVGAAIDRNGAQGVAVAQRLYDELTGMNARVVDPTLTTSIANFTVLLTDPATPFCQFGVANTGSLLASVARPAAIPTSGSPSTGGGAVAPPVPKGCTVQPGQKVSRQVMVFGDALTGVIMNEGELDTGSTETRTDRCADTFLGNCAIDFDGLCGDDFVDEHCAKTCGKCTPGVDFDVKVEPAMRAMSAEVSILGGHQIAVHGVHGATIFSYATRDTSNEFAIWNPESLTILFKGVDIDTHHNVNDGTDHRITTSWASGTGLLTVYDNGQEVFHTVTHQGETIGGAGKLVLGQDQDSFGGGFQKNDAYQGHIVAAAMANVAASGADISKGPLHTVLNEQSGLITSMVVGADGRPMDITGQQTYTTSGSVSVVTEPVDTALFVNPDCS